MGDVCVLDRKSGCPEPRHGCADQFGVERGDAVHHQREAQGLSGLVPELAVPDVAVVAEEDRVPQALDVLTLVQLAADPLPDLRPLQVAQDEEGLVEAPVLLQRSGERILAGEGAAWSTTATAGLHPHESWRRAVAGRPSAPRSASRRS